MSLADTTVTVTEATTSQSPKGKGKTPFRFTGWHMLACMVAFYAVIITVNFTMATMASRSWTGLVVKNSYVASQKFNDDLVASAEQAAKGWRSVVAYGDGVMLIEVSNRKGVQPVMEGATLFVGRPAFEQQDRSIPVSATDGAGRIVVPLNLEEGDWFARFEATVNGERYRRDVRFLVTADGQGKIR